MKHTKEQIKEIVLKILSDLEKDYYYPDEIEIQFEHNLKMLWGEPLANGWIIGVGIPSQQFPSTDGDVIVIKIDDHSGDVINYSEGPGRPVPCTVKPNEEGKYQIHVLGDFL